MNSHSSRRILSLWLRRLPTDRLTRQSPDLAGQPLAVVATIRSARQITALNDDAARLGLRATMSLVDARAMYPQLAAIDADDAADAAALDHIADWCDRYTPLIGLDPPDGLLLDISGCAHLFGGEENLRRDLVRRLAAQGFHTRAAIADTPGCAWAVATIWRDGPCRPTRHTLRSFPRKRESSCAPTRLASLATLARKRGRDKRFWVPAFAGTNGAYVSPPRRTSASIRRSQHRWRRPG